MKYLAIILFSVICVFAQGTPHVVYGTLAHGDGTPIDPACIEYSVTLDRTGDRIYYTPTHASATACTLTTDGLWMAQIASLHAWPGDTLTLEFSDVCDACGEVVTFPVIVDSSPAQDMGLVILHVCLWIDEGQVQGGHDTPLTIELFDILGNWLGATHGTREIPKYPDRSGLYFLRVTTLPYRYVSVIKVVVVK